MPSFLKKFQNQKNIAAIDLGTNALRAIIVGLSQNKVEIIKNFREPLRLGEDVFAQGYISDSKFEQSENTFIELLYLFTEHNVTEVKALATSAMRDAKNGKQLIQRIKKLTGIEIEVISGDEEGKIILDAVGSALNLSKKTAILMDIGGGSTEIIILKNAEIVALKSFNVGTIRLLSSYSAEELEQEIEKYLEKISAFISQHLGDKKPDLFIGTGGNLRRIGKIKKTILGKNNIEWATSSEIAHMKGTLFSMTYVDRLKQLELDQNRADVILPAILMAQKLMMKIKLKKIYLPKVGLKEGIILSMIENQKAQEQFISETLKTLD
jgi:exopolyphosphatase/guanosine-5'-triphosphate,3'-diphosphate pyrophosphatase